MIAGLFLTWQRPDAIFVEYNALGSPEQVSETMQRYIEAGAHKIVVRPLCSADESMEQLEIMGSEILPHFHNQVNGAG